MSAINKRQATVEVDAQQAQAQARAGRPFGRVVVLPTQVGQMDQKSTVLGRAPIVNPAPGPVSTTPVNPFIVKADASPSQCELYCLTPMTEAERVAFINEAYNELNPSGQ